MKIILGLILSSFVATTVLAQSKPVAQGSDPSATGGMTEHPPVPGNPETNENPKDPHADKQSGGAIIRKNDTPATKQPAKKNKAKKMEQKPEAKASEKKAAPITPTPGESVD